jgi:hypothetical protein
VRPPFGLERRHVRRRRVLRFLGEERNAGIALIKGVAALGVL